MTTTEISTSVRDLGFVVLRQPEKSTESTVWKLQDFSVIQILCETNFEGSKSCKSANLPFLGLCILLILYISALKKCKNSQQSEMRPSKFVKMTDFALQESPNLISHKIWVIEKSWNFHTVEKKTFTYCNQPNITIEWFFATLFFWFTVPILDHNVKNARAKSLMSSHFHLRGP